MCRSINDHFVAVVVVVMGESYDGLIGCVDHVKHHIYKLVVGESLDGSRVLFYSGG